MHQNRIRLLFVATCLMGGAFAFAAAVHGQDVTQESMSVLADGDSDDKGESRLVAFQPPAADQPTLSAPAAEPPPAPRFTRTRLARAPSMFGDFFAPSVQLTFGAQDPSSGNFTSNSADLPIGGALRRTKISDNNKALPVDRVYAVYNHFENAVSTQFQPPFGAPSVTRRESVDRYLVGFEKAFLCESMSVELRVPFATPTDFRFDNPAVGTGQIPGDEFGNLNLIFKVLAYRSCNFAAAVGLGIDLPTADDTTASFDQAFSPRINLRIENDAVYLQPFVAIAATPADRWFVNAFLELDLPSGGNDVFVSDPSGGLAPIGRLNDATLLEADVALGRWLYQCPQACYLQGLAGVVELHYMTMLNDPDAIAAMLPPFGNTIVLNNQFNRQDFLELTAGLHAALGETTTLRVAGVVPLRGRPDRTFDAEVMVQLNHFFR